MSTPRLTVRAAAAADIPGIIALSERVYGSDSGYTPEMLRGQLAQFAEGQMVAEYDGHIVGYCATFRVAAGMHRGGAE